MILDKGYKIKSGQTLWSKYMGSRGSIIYQPEAFMHFMVFILTSYPQIL